MPVSSTAGNWKGQLSYFQLSNPCFSRCLWQLQHGAIIMRPVCEKTWGTIHIWFQKIWVAPPPDPTAGHRAFTEWIPCMDMYGVCMIWRLWIMQGHPEPVSYCILMHFAINCISPFICKSVGWRSFNQIRQAPHHFKCSPLAMRPHIIKVLSQCPPIQRIEDAVPAQAMCWEASQLCFISSFICLSERPALLLHYGLLSDIVDWSFYIWAHLYWKSFLAAVDGSAWSARFF